LTSGLATVAAVAMPSSAPAAEKASPEDFTFCLNTSTIRGQKLTLVEEVEIAAKAGYQAIEPWINELEQHVKDGGSLKDVAKRIRDHGMVVPDVIGFFEWVVDDDDKRRKGLENARRGMDLAQQVGSARIAAPPVGATGQSDLNLLRAAERYRALLEVGDKIGVVPQVEVWGFSQALGRLGECALVAIECQHPKACVLADVYHLHKGGSGFTGLKQLGPAALQVFHMNDYPAQPPRADISDAHRVYPGDGVAPLKEVLRDLRELGFRGVLSLELFNRDYWKQDALLVARTGLAKMQAVAAASRG
jgi:sugar phosphate isomerase/epimerase